MSDFKFEMKGRVLDEREAYKHSEVDGQEWGDVTEADCQQFLGLLSEKAFGGIETIKAITLIHRVNILVINEDGPPYFPMGFNANCHRTVFIAY